MENDASWEWFLRKFHGVVGEIEDLVFISDCNQSIEKAIHNVFPNAHHGACMYHIRQNIKSKFENDTLVSLFFRAAKAYRMSEFDDLMEQINSVNPNAAQYLQKSWVCEVG